MITKDNLVKVLTWFYMIPMGIVLAVNVLFSMTRSTYFELYMQNELPSYTHDNGIFMFLVLVMSTVVMYFVYTKLIVKSKNEKIFAIAACMWAAIACLFFVFTFRCGAVCDAGHVNEMTIQFMQGDYSAFNEGTYLSYYPFQVGMIAFFEIIYRLFGMENFLAFQIVNTVCIVAVIYILNLITREIFEDETIVKAEAVMSMFLLPFFMFSTLVYGDIPGFALGTLAIYMGIRYLKTDLWKYALGAGICFMIGLVIKGNNLVFVVAVVIAIVLKTLQDKKCKRILAVIGIVILSQLGNMAVESMYMKRAGIDEMPTGTPKISWVAMGMRDTDETGWGCGWYNGYNMNVYKESGFDYDLATEKSIECIKDSIKNFASDPKHAVYYFYRKFTSSWNDPSFQSQIMNEWYSRYTPEPSELSHYLLYEEGRTLLFHIQNILHMVVFFFSAIGGIAICKKWSLERAYLVLNIFGGLIFHMLVWEIKGRYVLVYYVLLMPVAALGCKVFYEAIIKYMQKAKAYIDEKGKFKEA